MAGSIRLSALLSVCQWLSLAASYSFALESVPAQCQTLIVSVTGAGGSPPYSMMILPFNVSNEDPRAVLAQDFQGDSTSTYLQLNYPFGALFVIVASDANGYGSGGTSALISVGSSSDSSCIPSANVSRDFDYSFGDGPPMVQCQPMRVWWNSTDVQGSVTFFAAIIAGDAFQIPEGNITNEDGEGTGFSWTPNIAAGTTLIFTGGDDRGPGTLGWGVYQVMNGSSSSCLSPNSPSGALGPPSDAISVPTAVPTSDSDSSDSTSTQTKPGVIAGLIIGIAVPITILFVALRYCMRRRDGHPVDESAPNMSGKPDNLMQNLPGTAAVTQTPIHSSMTKNDTSRSDLDDQLPTPSAGPYAGVWDGSGSRRSFAGADSGESRASPAISNSTPPSSARRQLISVTSGPGMKDEVRMGWV